MNATVIATRKTGYGLVLVTVRDEHGRTAEGSAYSGSVELARYRAVLKLDAASATTKTCPRGAGQDGHPPVDAKEGRSGRPGQHPERPSLLTSRGGSSEP
jgi:hypothetical protein